MESWYRAIQQYHLRTPLVILTLFSHLIVVLGLPVPLRSPKDISNTYPCRDRPCGCFNAEECWKGDCCCFTLEQKLAWAEANGIEPPKHVRPMVQARKRATCTTTQSCCSTTEQSDPLPCCAEKSAPLCSTDESSGSRKISVRWVVGILAQKCRGEGPIDFMKFDPSVPPEYPFEFPARPQPGQTLVWIHQLTDSSSRTPPTPPPRFS